MAMNISTNTPDKYFKSDNSLNEENIKTFRDRYRTLSKIDRFDGHGIDETAILNAAEQLNIKVDLNEHKEILKECVKYEDEEQTFLFVGLKIQDPVQQMSFSPSPAAPPPISVRTTEEPNKNNIPTILTEIDCVVMIKQQGKYVDHFLQTFLLQVVTQNDTYMYGSSTYDTWSPCHNEKFRLHPGSVLALFIHEQINLLGTIQQRQSARLRLVEPVTITDDFSTWSYDHFRDLLEMELRPHPENIFPTRWTLANDARIRCQLIFCGARQIDETTASFILDRPRTNSLPQFIHDVCAKEDNTQTDNWLEALKVEDILSFAHLSNLKQNEWDNIKKLSVNAKKILKAAVDREKESAADDRRRWFEESSPNQERLTSSDTSLKESRSELFANLHLIKLFIFHTLRFERVFRNFTAPPKLETACIDASFEEILEEGYADDGLFPNMKEFFLPLTISEEELKMERSNINRQTRQNEVEVLNTKVQRLEELCREATTNRWHFDEQQTDMERTIKQAYTVYMNDRSQVHTKTASSVRAKELTQLDQQWKMNRMQLEQQLTEIKNELQQWITRVLDYEKQIDELNNQKHNIQTESSQPQRPVDKGLVKPARGFIMYGPPGTGKSEIMSKLSTKLGIAMVGPPLAAGELNRPLVGESERVIIALASRCHRIPYAMCCLSIDEIDSLAPKRDEDSSEGKVDKISVLLSLIDGIKDVPNLMIFCATNRLHMMDEAFLRRMSGKFFVGRPSSQARTKILAQIPVWALEPDLIDRLAIATTNFSGAACKAFTRAITVRCMAVQRAQPQFQVKYSEALTIADRTAQQYQILLGNETLPRLMLRNFMQGSRIRLNHLTRYTYTGRIIINLHDGSARIEVIENDDRIGVIKYKLDKNETSTQSILERLTVYGKDRNVQLIQLIDLNLLASQGAYDEKKVFETLKERYDECVAYPRSMIIYDLDALVGVNKSEADSSMGRSTNSAVVNQSVYTYVRARFREAVIEQQQEQGQSNKQQQTVEKWAVAVIREPFLLRQFAADVQFARTRHEKEELKIEQHKAEDLLKCVKCKDYYIENENKMGSCIHHDGFIIDNSVPNLTIYTLSKAVYELTKLEYDTINNPNKQQQFERQKNKFKWICCDATLTAGSSTGGCKKGKHKHSSGEEAGDIQRQDGYRLDKTAIKHWEDQCLRNQEYNEKRLALLENRS